jgi:hypothetical protein
MDPLVLVRGHLANGKQTRSTATRHRELLIVAAFPGPCPVDVAAEGTTREHD